ncbi:hypothetical protein GCQ56_03710 [Marinifilum sp. N1E240]|uniref:hypothetical protein n=1 Tax=Marinifilum sp. N1E240 TaxID=2608082 RepID=UPI00128B25F9|nr:hypothetical protein [Marinifilum sp. N1E240]MPQ46107.1 hypothetical protein [Marinifilum sp. N1E240]
MRKILVFIVIVCIANVSFGQEKNRVKEIGLAFNNLDEFGFVYKIGHEKSMWRFNVIALNNSKSETENLNVLDKEYKSLGFSFSAGKEYYSELTANFKFKYGWDLFYGYYKNKEKELSSNMYDSMDKLENKSKNYGVNLVLGINYPINDHIVLGAEVTPGISWYEKEYELNGNKTSGRDGYNFGLTNSDAKITLSYRF